MRLIICLWGFILHTVSIIGRGKTIKSDNYAVVIDAGSTGSRCFAFRVTLNENDLRNVSSYSCGKVVPGLSSFKSYPEEASAYLAPLLINAAQIIPRAKQPTTIVHIKATAGMRLLGEDVQKKILKSVVYGLNYRLDIPFLISKFNVGIIDGHEEAYFAVLASNFVAGSINGNLHPVDGMPMLGALDMGGSSTQLIFFNGTKDIRKVRAEHFWSNSWLNFGAQRVHERVLDHIYTSYIADMKARGMNVSIEKDKSSTRESGEDEGKDCCPDPIVVPNPCGFRDHTMPYFSHIIFKGTGEGEKCMEIIERVIWPTLDNEELKTACIRGRPCPIESIVHPSVRGHHFYAMSVYFYALDCMRHVGPNPLGSWPTPNLNELEVAAYQFCSWSWPELYDEVVNRRPHPYTREGQLHERCFESLYIITLLEKGFAFDKTERSITYALEVAGSEVEWTLGFALAEVDFRPFREQIAQVVDSMDSKTWKYFAMATLREMFAPIKLLLTILHSSLKLARRIVWGAAPA